MSPHESGGGSMRKSGARARLAVGRALRTFGCVGAVALIAMLLTLQPLSAGPADDLSSRKRDWEAASRNMEDISRRVNEYLEKSTNLRAMDKTDLEELINQMCKLDIERNDDEADRLATSLRDRIVDNVRREYDAVNALADRIDDDAERALNDAKSLRDNTKNLTSYPDIADEVTKLLSEMSDAIDRFTDRTYSKLTTDYRALTNLKEGVTNGANNPRIRASMEYGKRKHIDLQSSFSCDEKEVVLSSGRPDCILFKPDACQVIEFKPDTYSESAARSEAEGYVSDVRTRFKDDSRASQCKKDSNNLPIFEAKGELYPACRQ
jgi:hypothetical protein